MFPPDDGRPESSERTAALSDGRHPPRRLRLQTQATFVSRGGVHTAVTTDLGTGGLFLATRELLPPGERVRVVFTMPISDVRIEAEAEVRWVRDRPSATDSELVTGMGLRFLNLSPEARHAVEVFLRQRVLAGSAHEPRR